MQENRNEYICGRVSQQVTVEYFMQICYIASRRFIENLFGFFKLTDLHSRKAHIPGRTHQPTNPLGRLAILL